MKRRKQIVTALLTMALLVQALPTGSVSAAQTTTRYLTDANGVQQEIAGRMAADNHEIIDVNITDGKTHKVTIYLLDEDNSGRWSMVDVIDPDTQKILDNQNVYDFADGVYLSYNLSGHVQIRLTNVWTKRYTKSKDTAVYGVFIDEEDALASGAAVVTTAEAEENVDATKLECVNVLGRFANAGENFDTAFDKEAQSVEMRFDGSIDPSSENIDQIKVLKDGVEVEGEMRTSFYSVTFKPSTQMKKGSYQVVIPATLKNTAGQEIGTAYTTNFEVNPTVDVIYFLNGLNLQTRRIELSFNDRIKSAPAASLVYAKGTAQEMTIKTGNTGSNGGKSYEVSQKFLPSGTYTFTLPKGVTTASGATSTEDYVQVFDFDSTELSAKIDAPLVVENGKDVTLKVKECIGYNQMRYAFSEEELANKEYVPVSEAVSIPTGSLTGSHTLYVQFKESGVAEESESPVLHKNVKMGVLEAGQTLPFDMQSAGAYDKDGFGSTAHPQDGVFDLATNEWSNQTSNYISDGTNGLSGKYDKDKDAKITTEAGITYQLSTDIYVDGKPNVATGNGKTVPAPSANTYEKIYVLAAGKNDSNKGTFTLNYADGTKETQEINVHYWADASKETGNVVFSGINTCLGWAGNGIYQMGVMRQYELEANPSKVLTSVTLPKTSNLIRVFAMTGKEADKLANDVAAEKVSTEKRAVVAEDAENLTDSTEVKDTVDEAVTEVADSTETVEDTENKDNTEAVEDTEAQNREEAAKDMESSTDSENDAEGNDATDEIVVETVDNKAAVIAADQKTEEANTESTEIAEEDDKAAVEDTEVSESKDNKDAVDADEAENSTDADSADKSEDAIDTTEDVTSHQEGGTVDDEDMTYDEFIELYGDDPVLSEAADVTDVTNITEVAAGERTFDESIVAEKETTTGGYGQSLYPYARQPEKLMSYKIRMQIYGQTSSNNYELDFEDALEAIRRVDNLTRGLEKKCYLVGWQLNGHDTGFPDLSVVNPRHKRPMDATSLDSLKWLIKEAKEKYNTTITLHVNFSDAYTDDDPLSPEMVKNQLMIRKKDGSLRTMGVGWAGHSGYYVNAVANYFSGNWQKNIIAPLLTNIPELEGQSIHPDAWYSHADPYYGDTNYDTTDAQRRSAKYLRDTYGMDLTTEFDVAFGAGENHPEDHILYFPMIWQRGWSKTNPLMTPAYIQSGVNELDYSGKKLSASGRYFGEGTAVEPNLWNGTYAPITLPGLKQSFAEKELTRQYLNTLLRSSLTDDEATGGEAVLYAGDGTKVISAWNGDSTIPYKRTVTVEDDVILQEPGNVFMPMTWRVGNEIQAWSQNGYTDKSWKLPKEWEGVTKVDIYDLSVEGLRFIASKDVTDRTFTMSLQKDESAVIVPHGANPNSTETFAQNGSVQFLGRDTETSGNWTSTYGKEGYELFETEASEQSMPEGVELSFVNGNVREVSTGVVAVTSISLDKDAEEMASGEKLTLTATVGPENATDKTVVWSSSDEEVATVSENGEVTAVGAGTAIITAKAGNCTAEFQAIVDGGTKPDPNPENPDPENPEKPNPGNPDPENPEKPNPGNSGSENPGQNNGGQGNATGNTTGSTTTGSTTTGNGSNTKADQTQQNQSGTSQTATATTDQSGADNSTTAASSVKTGDVNGTVPAVCLIAGGALILLAYGYRRRRQ